MKYLFVWIFLVTISFSNENFEKHLVSELRAEVYAQNLLDGGYDEDLQSFLSQALKKYPENEDMLMYNATSLYHLKKLQESKKYFKKALKVNPANEQASDFIEKIEDQESSQENKVLEKLIEYLSDKGLDFLMIFLAFLGGEIIAKKYTQCSKYTFLVSVAKYRNRKDLASSYLERIKFSVSNCCASKTIISICSFLEVLIAFTIVIALLIVWLMIEFLSGFTMLLSEPIALLSSHTLWTHSAQIFFLLLFFTIFIKFVAYLQSFEDDESLYILEVVEQLEQLYDNKEYILLQKAISKIKENKEELNLIISKINGDFKEYIIKNAS